MQALNLEGMSLTELTISEMGKSDVALGKHADLEARHVHYCTYTDYKSQRHNSKDNLRYLAVLTGPDSIVLRVWHWD